MKLILTITHIVLSIILISLVLIQQRGTGLSQVFGGSNAAFHTKRGLEKIIFVTTIVVAILFFGLSLTILFLAKIL